MTQIARFAALRASATLHWLIPSLLLVAGTAGTHSQAHADQWYVGIGGAASLLQPDTESGVDAEDDLVLGPTIFFGHDVSQRLSVQVQLHGLVEVDYETSDAAPGNNSASYTGADGSVLFRLLDSRRRSVNTGRGVALYARLGLGFMDRDSDLDLEYDEPTWFGLGGGIEIYLNQNLAVRAEGLYLDRDAAAGYLSLVGRFGGQEPSVNPPSADERLPAAAPTEAAASDAASSPTAIDDAATSPSKRNGTPTDVPATRAPVPDDQDGDGIRDRQDLCPGSASGFPVQDNGCALLDGVLTGVRFAPGTAELLPGATEQLNFLADVLGEYPDARIELHAHSDNAGSTRDQAIITRARLKTVGTYMVSQGISASRLTLRSFGASRPLYNNDTPNGRAANNRIEIVEKRF
jgi:outer membrane protein OmpA-like peptidoglycan-associated protein